MLEVRYVDNESILHALASGVSIVTANRRQAATLGSRFAAYVQASGQRVWATPDVLSWQAWLLRAWQHQVFSHGHGVQRLLNESQEQLLWERILRSSSRADSLLQITATAKRLREAATLMHHWQISPRALEREYNEDVCAFREWWQQLMAICRKGGWLLPAQLADAVFTTADAGSETQLATRLWLFGFDEINPQQAALVLRLQQMGHSVEWVMLQGQEADAHLVMCDDLRSQALLAARWARARLEQHPHARLAIIVPDLAAVREPLVQALERILVPSAQWPGNGDCLRPYDLSLGPPLLEYPLVQTAMDMLGLLRRELPLAVLGRILRSPFLAHWESERDARAQLDARLRECGELRVSLHTLRYWAGREGQPYHCPLLLARINALLEGLPATAERRPAGVWVEYLNSALHALGWAQGRSLSSDEYQTQQAFRECLAQLAGLEEWLGKIPVDAALGQVQGLLAVRSFQPQRPELPLQVMGVLEAAGQTFDYAWVLGLHDGIWPAAPRPNPFLPLALQARLGMPHATAERELQVAEVITRRLLGCAPEVIVSVPCREGDQVLRPSPLVAHLPHLEAERLSVWQGPVWWQEIRKNAQLEPLTGDAAPALVEHLARGGTQLFKHQAACPFRAYAELRLGARPLEQADIGLDSRARGSLLHRVLETIWKQLGNQQALLDLSPASREQLVREAVETALTQLAQQYPDTLTQRFRSVEQERLQRHTLAWLALETERAPFVDVAAEQACTLSLGGVQVQVKVDRIDTLPDGRKLLIDYKTGKVQPRQWFGERPEEPQLPLYSAAVEGPIAGVLFGQLQAGELRFNGVLEEAGLVPQVKDYTRLKYCQTHTSWSQLLSDWRSKLEQLASDFRMGMAAVDPKEYPKTCRYCHLSPLCRIHERSGMPAAEEEWEQEDE